MSEPCQSEHPQFGLRWKIFELDGCEGAGKVCLVFPPKSDGAQIDDSGNIHVDLTPPDPQVWFLDRAFEWHFLACNFPTYFRMMLVHLGLPLWQMRFTSMGLTQVSCKKIGTKYLHKNNSSKYSGCTAADPAAGPASAQ